MQINKADFDTALIQRITPKVFEALNKESVAIAGLGGLGSHIAIMLARSGIGHLHLVDFDVVDMSNLNRQAYFIRQLGMHKTAALQEIICDINPFVRVTTEQKYIDETNASKTFIKYRYVCEAFDKSENKATLVNTLLQECLNTIIISGSGMSGYESANKIITRKALSRLYICGDEQTEVADYTPLTSSRVTVCAAHQAHTIIRLILGEESA